MKIIISPAKKMEECSDLFEPGGFPVFLDRTKRLHERLCSMSEEELNELFKANDRSHGKILNGTRPWIWTGR